MTIRYQAKRHALWAYNDASLDRLIEKDTWAASWDSPSDLPAVSVTEELSCALLCIYAGDQRRGEVFLKRTVGNADRLIMESRYLDTEVAKAGHPWQLGKILRGRVHARWLLGQPLDRAELRRVAGYLVSWCLTTAEDHARFSSPITMDAYIQGVRAAVIACDLDYAAELLRTRQKLRWHFATERSLWTRLVRDCPELTDAFDTEFEAFFDTIRDPDYHDGEGIRRVPFDREIFAFEAGIIRQAYIINASPLDPISPNEVIKAIAR